MPAGAWTKRGGGKVTAVRWGVIGTAGIARRNFLPAVREAGGEAAAVAGRDAERTAKRARDNGIGRPGVGYQNLIDDPRLGPPDLPLPNGPPPEWTDPGVPGRQPGLCAQTLA